MRPTGRLAVAAAAVAMIGAVNVMSLVGVRSAEPLADSGDTERADRSSAVPGEAASFDRAETSARQLFEPEVQPALPHELVHPFEFELGCTVLDLYGLPVQGAQVLFAPLGCSLNPWPLETQADGTTVLRWRGKQPSMQMAICLRAPGQQEDRGADMLQLVQAHAGAKQHVAFLAERALPGWVAVTRNNATNSCEFASQRQDCSAYHDKPGAVATKRKPGAAVGPHPEASSSTTC